MIAVAGGSGLLGRLVVADLEARGEQVRVLVRDAARAEQLLPGTVEVRPVDVRRRAGLAAALQGATAVLSLVHGFLGGRSAGPHEIDDRGNGNLIAVARDVAADVVLVSVLGAAADSPLELFRAKYAAERALRSSGVAWTIVRPGPFLETWTGLLLQTAGRSGRPLIFGRGEQPLAFTPVADVAALVARAGVDTALRGHTLNLAGPAMTMRELAATIRTADGRLGPPRHLRRPLLRAGALLAPLAPAFARQNHTALLMDQPGLLPGNPGDRPRS